jgi:CTD small phosphatase-like protein 2
MNHMLLVDNAAYSYFFQLKNGIPIVPYYKGKNDYELQYL